MERDKYTLKGKDYVILGFTMMKCPTTRVWLKAVKYMQLETGLEFVREECEYFSKFKIIES